MLGICMGLANGITAHYTCLTSSYVWPVPQVGSSYRALHNDLFVGSMRGLYYAAMGRMGENRAAYSINTGHATYGPCPAILAWPTPKSPPLTFCYYIYGRHHIDFCVFSGCEKLFLQQR